MTGSNERFSILRPFSIEERITVAYQAVDFFSTAQYKQKCLDLGKNYEESKIYPFSTLEFMKYLVLNNNFPEANRHMYNIERLLNQLTQAHILDDMGMGSSPPFGRQYYFLKEFTNVEKQGILWLAPGLGPEFLNYMYKSMVLRISGIDKNGIERAGTGIAITPRWILTCAHIINQMSVNDLQKFGNKDFHVVRKLVHEDIDVALIKVDSDLSITPGASFREPELQDTVFTVGYPTVPQSREAFLIMQRGEVISPIMTNYWGQQLFLYSAIARPGNSGGPIIAASGHIVGIVSESLEGRNVKSNDSKKDSFSDKDTAEKSDDPQNTEENNALELSVFYAGVPTSQIQRALSDLLSGEDIKLTIEDYS
jgi:S1-C subfamily serine protease